MFHFQINVNVIIGWVLKTGPEPISLLSIRLGSPGTNLVMFLLWNMQYQVFSPKCYKHKRENFFKKGEMQSHSPGVRPWWCGSCVRRARWSWRTSFSGRIRPAYSQGPHWRAPWRQDPSSLLRFHWLAGWGASVPLGRLGRVRTDQLVQDTQGRLIFPPLLVILGLFIFGSYSWTATMIWKMHVSLCFIIFWQMCTLSKLNLPFTVPFCNVTIDKQTTISGVVLLMKHL